MYGLTILKDYLDEILNGAKTCDARSCPTNKRGTITLVNLINMTIYELVDLVDCHPIICEEYRSWHTIGQFKGFKFEYDASKSFMLMSLIIQEDLLNQLRST